MFHSLFQPMWDFTISQTGGLAITVCIRASTQIGVPAKMLGPKGVDYEIPHQLEKKKEICLMKSVSSGPKADNIASRGIRLLQLVSEPILGSVCY